MNETEKARLSAVINQCFINQTYRKMYGDKWKEKLEEDKLNDCVMKPNLG